MRLLIRSRKDIPGEGSLPVIIYGSEVEQGDNLAIDPRSDGFDSIVTLLAA